MQRLVFWLLLLAAQSNVGAAPDDNALLSGGRLTEQDSGSQLVLDLDRQIDYRFFHLENPPRLVLDMADTRLGVPLDRLDLRSADVVRVRSGVRENGRVLRFVMELRDRIDYKTTLLHDQGYRLVIDFFRPNLNAAASSRRSVRLASLAPRPLAPARALPAAAPAPLMLRSTTADSAATRPAVADRPAIRLASAEAIGDAGTTVESGPPARPIVLATAGSRAPAAPAAPVVPTPPPPVAAGVEPPSPFVIAIDPGHGGKDPGALGPKGTREADVVLQIGKRLQRLIDARPGMKACLTRADDTYLGLHRRVAIARQRCKASLFISIHADAYQGKTPSGASVFVLSTKGASSAMARHLAHNENNSGDPDDRFDVEDENLKRVLLDMVQNAVLGESRALAGEVLRQLGSIGKLHGDKRVEHAAFAVLKAHDIPSILIETAFLSNPEEEKKLLSTHYQQRLAKAILAGVDRYLQVRPQLFQAPSTIAQR